jgi:Tfp pilus assembly major pilin PilA
LASAFGCRVFLLMKHVTSLIQKGVAIVEGAVVVATTGLVIGVALPAYRDYGLREKVAEMVEAASPAQTTVADYAKSAGELPATGAIALPFVIGSRHVQETSWSRSGAVGTLTISAPADLPGESLAGKSVRLTARYNPATRGVEWTCTAANATSVDERHLPKSCLAAANRSASTRG